jgi:uncharacterized protein YjdB
MPIGRPKSSLESRIRAAAVLAMTLTGLTCHDSNPLSPGLPTQLHVAVAPQLQRSAVAGGPSFVSLAKVVGVLAPVGGGTPYMVEAPFVRDTAVLTFDVTFAGTSQRYALTLAATDTAGDTLFKSTREIVASPGDNAPVHDVLQYVAADTAVRFLSVALSDTALVAGDSLSLSAIGYDDRERVITPLYIGWTSRDTMIARISSRGPSQAKIFGRDVENDVWVVGQAFNGATDSVLVPVRLKIGSVVLDTDTLRLVQGNVATLAADVRSATGASLDRPVAWSSLDETVATVVGYVGGATQALKMSVGAASFARGQVLAVRPGTTRIVATSGNRSDTTVVVVAAIPVASVLVTPDTIALLVGELGRFTVEARDAQGNVLAGRPIGWTSSNSLIASVGADGTVQGIAVGAATITATSEGISAAATVRVNQLATTIARTVISPASVTLEALGEATQLVARSYAPDSTLVAGKYTFTVRGAQGIVSVDALGLVTAIGIGSAYVVATEDGGTVDSALVTVAQVAKSVQVSAPVRLDALGLFWTFHATAFDANGTPIPNVPLAWTVGDAAVGVIALSGGDSLVVQSVGSGVTPIIAAAGNVTGSSQLTVSQVAKSATVSPKNIVLGLEGRARLTLAVFDANGAPMTYDPKEAKWTIESGQGAVEVDSVGEVHAKSFGLATVYADVMGVRSTTASVDVSDAAPSLITFSVDTLAVGPEGALVSVYLSLAAVADITVALSDPLGLVKFDQDTLLFDKGRTHNDVLITGLGDGTTTITAEDVGKLFSPASMTVFAGKAGTKALVKSTLRSVGTPTPSRSGAATP